MVHYLVLLFDVLCSIFHNLCSLYIAIHFFTFTILPMLSSNALTHHVLAFCLIVDLKIWCVYVENVLNIIYFVAYLVVGFHLHLHVFSFII